MPVVKVVSMLGFEVFFCDLRQTHLVKDHFIDSDRGDKESTCLHDEYPKAWEIGHRFMHAIDNQGNNEKENIQTVISIFWDDIFLGDLSQKEHSNYGKSCEHITVQ